MSDASDERSPEDNARAGERHTETMVERWLAAERPDNGVLVSFDEESSSIGVGLLTRQADGTARLGIALIGLEEAIAIREELGEYIDYAILANFHRMTRPDADD